MTSPIRYLVDGAAEGLWVLLAEAEAPHVDRPGEVLVLAGVGWSMYDVEAFKAFAVHLRREPRTVYATNYDDATPDNWPDWGHKHFPGVEFPDNHALQPPWVARYMDGDLMSFESGHLAHKALHAGLS